MTAARPVVAAVAVPSAPVSAPLSRRAAAYVVDAVIGTLIPAVVALSAAALASAVLRPADTLGAVVVVMLADAAAAVAGLAWFLVYTAMQGRAGSPGQRALGVVLRDAASGGPVGFGRALLRNVVWGLCAAVIVGYLSPLFDRTPHRQGWHDKASHAVVTARIPGPPAAAARSAVGDAQPDAPASAPATHGLWLSPPPAAATPPEEPAAAPARRAGGVIDTVPGMPGRPAASAPAAPPAAPAPSAASGMPAATDAGSLDVDDALDETVMAVAPSPAVRRMVGAPVRPSVVLVWDTGVRTAVYGRTLFGRNPTRESGAEAVTVRDETMSLSKTHFELAVDADGAWVVDRRSTNGVVLVRAERRATVVPGERTPVRAGDRLEFGDRSALVEAGA